MARLLAIIAFNALTQASQVIANTLASAEIDDLKRDAARRKAERKPADPPIPPWYEEMRRVRDEH